MDHELDHASESRRLGEVDAAMRTLNLGMAGTVAAAAVLFVHQFSVAFAVFASLPLLFWLVRLSTLGPLMSVRGWNIASLPVMITSIGAAALLSGGADSPVAFFVGVVALWGNAMFANLARSTALGVGSLIVLAGIDLALGRTIELMTFVCALVIAGYLPFFVDRMVQVEQLHRRRSVVDQLTGCLNRHALESRSVELEEQGARTNAELSVVMFDLDHFKAINDRYGHAQGDRVLAHVAYEARKHLRRFELVYRLGGEEFAVLLPGAGAQVAAAMAERIRDGIENSPLDHVGVTASFGVASCAAPFSVEQVINMADRRLYLAKATGRNCVVDRDIELEPALAEA